METPVDFLTQNKIPFVYLNPLSKKIKSSSGSKMLGDNQSLMRAVIRNIFWLWKIRPFVKKNILRNDLVVLLNDAAFPKGDIADWLRKRKIPFFLMQEGIRFEIPAESEGRVYGAGGAETMFVWGKQSAAYFSKIVRNGTKICVAGSPRYTEIVRNYFYRAPEKGLIGLFTNPIDDMGYCTTAEKYQLIKNFFSSVSNTIIDSGCKVLIKPHPREDLERYTQIFNELNIPYITGSKDVFECISKVNAGIIFASTVGLELRLFNKNLGQLEIPNAGFLFDYVSSGQAIPFYINDVEANKKLHRLLNDHVDSSSYIENHLGNIAQTVKIIADHLMEMTNA